VDPVKKSPLEELLAELGALTPEEKKALAAKYVHLEKDDLPIVIEEDGFVWQVFRE